MQRIGSILLTLCLMLGSVAWASSAEVESKPSLTLEGARTVLAAAVAKAHESNAGGAIAVVDAGGNVIAVERLNGTFAAAATISIGKARTAALFQRPTRVFEEIIGKGRTSMVALDDFTPLQGGVPILQDGVVVGAVGVSGAMSAQQDDEIATAAAAALGTHPSMTPVKITYLQAERVKAAFERGEPLLEVAEYKIHASRREKPGLAEVHELETDIVYVLEGSATFVTGGSVQDAKNTAPNEIRGRGIQGGSTQRIRKGDVVVVPAGTPHWFKEVDGPVLYYVVKVIRNSTT